MEESGYFQAALSVALALAGRRVFRTGRDKLGHGLLLFIGTLGLGDRTFPVTGELNIIPAELVLSVRPSSSLGDTGQAGTAWAGPGCLGSWPCRRPAWWPGC